MEKLSGATSSTSPKPSPAEGASSTPIVPEIVPSKPKINITKAPTSTPVSAESQKLGAQASLPVRANPAGGLGKRRRGAEEVTQNTSSSQSQPPAKKIATGASIGLDEPQEIYENRIISQIFRITLDPNQKVDTSNHKLIFLPELRKELEEDGAEIRFSAANLDAAILEAASSIPHSKSVFEYLLPCWKRITKALKGLRGYSTSKDQLLKEAKRLCMSHCIFAAEMPDIFRFVIL